MLGCALFNSIALIFCGWFTIHSSQLKISQLVMAVRFFFCSPSLNDCEWFRWSGQLRGNREKKCKSQLLQFNAPKRIFGIYELRGFVIQNRKQITNAIYYWKLRVILQFRRRKLKFMFGRFFVKHFLGSIRFFGINNLRYW